MKVRRRVQRPSRARTGSRSTCAAMGSSHPAITGWTIFGRLGSACPAARFIAGMTQWLPGKGRKAVTIHFFLRARGGAEDAEGLHARICFSGVIRLPRLGRNLARHGDVVRARQHGGRVFRPAVHAPAVRRILRWAQHVLEFDSSLGGDAVVEWMLDLAHLGDEIGHFHQRLGRIPPRADDVHVLSSIF